MPPPSSPDNFDHSDNQSTNSNPQPVQHSSDTTNTSTTHVNALPPFSRFGDGLPSYFRTTNSRGSGSRLNSLDLISDYYFQNRSNQPRPSSTPSNETSTSSGTLPSLENIWRIARSSDPTIGARSATVIANDDSDQQGAEVGDDDDDDDDDDEEADDNEDQNEEDDMPYVTDPRYMTHRYSSEGHSEDLQDYSEQDTQRAIQFIDSIDVRDDPIEGESGMSPYRGNFSRMRSTVPPGANESNERLLLSSARQNTTSSNRIIIRPLPIARSESPNRNNSGVPLQRQNALRSRNRVRSSNKRVFYKTNIGTDQKDHKKLLELTIGRRTMDSADLQEELKIFIEDFKKNMSPYSLFSDSHMSQGSRKSLLGSSRRIGYIRADLEHTFQLDKKMDKFLSVRQSRALWAKKIENSKRFRTRLVQTPSTKRKLFSAPPQLEVPARRDWKRRKLRVMSRDSSEEVENPQEDETIYNPSFSDLSTDETFNILSVQYSSLFRAGSSFGVAPTRSTSLYSDLFFSEVNYECKEINGHFDLGSNNSWSNFWAKLSSYTNFFCGSERFSETKLLGNSSFARRLFLLKRVEKILPSTLEPNSFKLQSFTIPFSGKIVDFKKNDLRFLPASNFSSKKKDPSETYAFTKLSSPWFKLHLVTLQVSEWMRLQPFQQFKDEYLFSYTKDMLEELKKMSSDGSKAPTDDTIGLVNEYCSNFHILTKSVRKHNRPRASELPRDSNRFYSDYWEEWLSKELFKKLTDGDCSKLIDVQLNYILFTLKIDLVKYLDNTLEYLVENLESETNIQTDGTKLANECKEIRHLMEITKLFDNENTENEDISAILVCSLNRKTGEVELHNTLPSISFKNQSTRRNIGVVDTGLFRYPGGTRSGSSSVPVSMERSSALFDSYTSWGRWDDNNMTTGRPTRTSQTRYNRDRDNSMYFGPYDTEDSGMFDMCGYSKMGLKCGFANGEGNPSFDIN